VYGPAGGFRTHCLAIKSRLLIRMSFHGMVVPLAWICTCVLALKRRLLSCLSFSGVGVVGECRTLMTLRPPRFELGASAVPPRRQIGGACEARTRSARLKDELPNP